MKHRIKRIVSNLRFILLDLIIIIGLNVFGLLGLVSLKSLDTWIIICSIALFKVIFFGLFKEYRQMTELFGIEDAIKLVSLSFVTSVFCYIISFVILDLSPTNVTNFLLISIAEPFLLTLIRCFTRIKTLFIKNKFTKSINTIIIGAGAGGKIVYDECKSNEALKNKVVAFVDDDEKKIGTFFSGVPVDGPIKNIKEIIDKYDAKEIIISTSKLSSELVQYIFDLLSESKVSVKMLSLISNTGSQVKKNHIIDINITELLSREPIELNNDGLHDFVHDKVVLVTGAGGSIGSELVRQIYKQKPKTLILLDIYENALYDIQQYLVRKIRKHNDDIKLITLVGATYNYERMNNIFHTYRPELVFHAAAYKHVPLMEDSPTEAIRSNVIGTYNIAKLSDLYKVHKMVLVSTDKAVRPTNVMGATKRFAELIIQYFSSISKETKYSAVRFGNVLGSNGSVIPLFKKQIEEGGPVTVTDREMRRFFMTIPEAVSLILQSAVYATGGEIFILDMGKPVKIITLAEKMIQQAGYVPYVDIPIVISGLRPGEKIYEELLIDLSTQIRTANKKIFIEQPVDVVDITKEIEFISQVFEIENVQTVKDLLAKVITTYHQPERDKVGV